MLEYLKVLSSLIVKILLLISSSHKSSCTSRKKITTVQKLMANVAQNLKLDTLISNTVVFVAEP